MTDRDSFLAAILAAPDDDTVRVAFADWLDDHGEPERGEFIRVQCELAIMGNECPADDPLYCAKFNRWHALRRRELELLDHNNCSAWALPPEVATDRNPFAYGPRSEARFDYLNSFSGQFRRGFVHQITGDWDAVRDHLDAIIRVQPVRRVVLTTRPEDLARHRETGEEMMLPRINGAKERCRLRWPGVEFDLPPVSTFTINPGETAILLGGQRIAAPPGTRLEGRFVPGREWAEFDTDHPAAAP